MEHTPFTVSEGDCVLCFHTLSRVACGCTCAGPYKVNGVPLRRINQAYVIATSKTVDVSGVKLPESVNDKFFKAADAGKAGKSEAAFFEGDAPKVRGQRTVTTAASILTLCNVVVAARCGAGFRERLCASCCQLCCAAVLHGACSFVYPHCVHVVVNVWHVVCGCSFRCGRFCVFFCAGSRGVAFLGFSVVGLVSGLHSVYVS